jgi:hypothetical protein
MVALMDSTTVDSMVSSLVGSKVASTDVKMVAQKVALMDVR